MLSARRTAPFDPSSPGEKTIFAPNSRSCPSGRSSTSGVLPTRSRRLGAVRVSATGHRRQEDHGRTGADLGLEPLTRAHVLALDVDVDEWGEVVILHQLRPE